MTCCAARGRGLACLCRSGSQSTDAQEVVGSSHQVRGHLCSSLASVARSSKDTDGFAPAEDLLDSLSDSLAADIAGMASGASVDHRATSFVAVPIPIAPRSHSVFIGFLFRIERTLPDSPRKKKEKIREKRSRPIVDAFFSWCDAEAAREGGIAVGTALISRLGPPPAQNAAPNLPLRIRRTTRAERNTVSIMLASFQGNGPKEGTPITRRLSRRRRAILAEDGGGSA